MGIINDFVDQVMKII